ncbi:nuclear transport factor 2 family protein [Sphingomonas naphthae]|uniref:Nuclear transport factor 2 family protein n=1 Tax=Sphingomonas naphthae TaxID=1813468 RepID=A0ABY7TF39_9SPHN|nr:nuclear transport factor 2 family protein [Sphingomonas naphthae]WCT71867.1 nuclear transport factor 2 family protein [Sphingomonas naphthae]
MTDILLAEYGIRQLHARFVDAVFRKDAEAFGQCFARDADWKIATMHMHGRDEIASTFARLLGGCRKVMVIAGTPLLDFGAEGVSSRLHCTELAKMMDGSSALTLGVYFDRYVEEDGAWRFAWRHWALHYRGPVDLSLDVVDCPDYGAPPELPGPDEPTITRRVL